MNAKTMTTFKDKLTEYRKQYAAMRTPRAKGRFLDSLVQAHALERKYL